MPRNPLPDHEKPLTKADTVALWHAVEWLAHGVRHPTGISNLEAQVAAREILDQARRALRKVNNLRKQGV